jgi:hypothetical protein
MTDPERISKRPRGLAAQLLQAGKGEQPSDTSIEQTLAALGVSGAVLTTTSTASAAAAGSAKLSSAVSAGAGDGGAGLAAGGTAKAVSAALLVKWIGIGVVGGVGLAGAAAVATAPRASKAPTHMAASVAASAPLAVAAAAPVVTEPAPPSVVIDVPAPGATSVGAPVAHVSVSEPAAAAPVLEVGAPLAAEVAFVDRARALLAAGQSEQGLALLRGYEREFPEARLLPEVLFLQLETCDRLGRTAEGRAAAQRLLDGFPKSPHASRARKLLAQ